MLIIPTFVQIISHKLGVYKDSPQVNKIFHNFFNKYYKDLIIFDKLHV